MGRKTGASRNTSPVWCVACARSLLHVRVPSENEDNGLPLSKTTQEASAVSQNASGFLQKEGKYRPKKR